MVAFTGPITLVSWLVAPILKVGLGFVILTVTTGIGALTVMVLVAVLFPSAVVHVMIAFPEIVPAVTSPVALTEATLMLLDVQLTF